MNQILTGISQDKITEEIKENLGDVLLRTNFTETFNILYDLCTISSSSTSISKLFHVYLLKQFLTKHNLRNLFIEQTIQNLKNQSNTSSLSGTSALVQKLTNLPDKMYNFSATNKVFNALHYFKMLSVDIWTSLKFFHSNKSIDYDSNQFSFELLCNVFGKVSFLGYSGRQIITPINF
jgi:hypothetical protein